MVVTMATSNQDDRSLRIAVPEQSLAEPGEVDNFTTWSGSKYQIDVPTNRVRRLGNASGRAPTPRQGVDGEWRTYHHVDVVLWFDGERSFTFCWTIVEGIEQHTQTSPVMTGTLKVMTLLSHTPRGWA